MKRFWIRLAGIGLILVGIAGIILPVLQGTPFLLMGISLLSPPLAARLKRTVFRRFFKSEVLYFEEWETKRDHVYAGITERKFPIKLHKTTDLENTEAQARFREFFENDKTLKTYKVPIASRYVVLNQTHGDRVVCLDDPEIFKNKTFHYERDTDGVISNLKDVNLLVMTADCLSIYFSARDWVGVVHAGWRGTQAGIGAKALKMISEKSKTPIADVKIYLGPCISTFQYEVGPEFKDYFPESVVLKKGKYYFDLLGENRRQLLALGAGKKKIIEAGLCTFRESEIFYSFRREKEEAGRMVSFIQISSS